MTTPPTPAQQQAIELAIPATIFALDLFERVRFLSPFERAEVIVPVIGELDQCLAVIDRVRAVHDKEQGCFSWSPLVKAVAGRTGSTTPADFSRFAHNLYLVKMWCGDAKRRTGEAVRDVKAGVGAVKALARAKALVAALPTADDGVAWCQARLAILRMDCEVFRAPHALRLAVAREVSQPVFDEVRAWALEMLRVVDWGRPTALSSKIVAELQIPNPTATATPYLNLLPGMPNKALKHLRSSMLVSLHNKPELRGLVFERFRRVRRDGGSGVEWSLALVEKIGGDIAHANPEGMRAMTELAMSLRPPGDKVAYLAARLESLREYCSDFYRPIQVPLAAMLAAIPILRHEYDKREWEALERVARGEGQSPDFAVATHALATKNPSLAMKITVRLPNLAQSLERMKAEGKGGADDEEEDDDEVEEDGEEEEEDGGKVVEGEHEREQEASAAAAAAAEKEAEEAAAEEERRAAAEQRRQQEALEERKAAERLKKEAQRKVAEEEAKKIADAVQELRRFAEAEAERRRVLAEAERQQQKPHLEAEAEARAYQDKLRKDAEQRRRAERQQREVEKRQKAAEAVAEAESKARDAERQLQEAEAAEKQRRDAERRHREAEAERKLRDAERRQREAEAAEKQRRDAERRHREAEAERKLRDAERRQREAEAAEKQRRDAERRRQETEAASKIKAATNHSAPAPPQPRPTPPQTFVCPISGKIMEDPCIASSGNTYDRKSLLAYFQKNPHQARDLLNPREVLDRTVLIPNLNLKTQICDWKLENLTP
jgi:hypothetical protein